jgi:hypothetical protein
MNIWFRRFLVILTVGGGFLGAVITANVVFSAKDMSVVGYAILTAFIGLYVYGIFAGMRLSENPSRYGHVLAFFLLQVPFFSSPILVYRFACGFHATVGVVGFSLGGMFRLGSDWQMAILQPNSWGVGINLFAAAVSFALLVQYFVFDAEEPSPVSEPPRPYEY